MDFPLRQCIRIYIVHFALFPRRNQSPVNSLSSPSFSKRPRLLPPHFYCSVSRDKIKQSFLVSHEGQEAELEEEDESTTATEDLEEEELPPVNGPGPRNNSTPRQGHAEADPLVLTPQSMPVSRKTFQYLYTNLGCLI